MSSFKLVLICMSLMLAVCAAKPRKSGTKSGKINKMATTMAGGQPVNVKTVPFIVSIKNVPFDYHKCAGFLVTPRHVVTTATCLYPASKGNAQAYLLPSTLDHLGEGYDLIDWTIHYNYSVLPRENDIAVATLRKSVPVSRVFRYPEISKWASLPKAAEVCTYGWGFTKVDRERYGNFTMHVKSLKVMSNAMCSLLLHEYLRCDTICASSDSQFASASADVGTPLIYRQGYKNYFVGMLSKPTEKLVSSATFMSLYEYREFIESVINGTKPLWSTSTTPKPTTTTTEPTTTVAGEEGGEGEGEGEAEGGGEGEAEDENYSADTEDDYGVARRRKYRRRQDNGRYGKFH